MRRQTVVDRAIAAADPPLTERQASFARAMLRNSPHIDRIVLHTLPGGEPFSAVGEGSHWTGWRRIRYGGRTADNIEITVRLLSPDEMPPEEFLNAACPVLTRRQIMLYRLRAVPGRIAWRLWQRRKYVIRY